MSRRNCQRLTKNTAVVHVQKSKTKQERCQCTSVESFVTPSTLPVAVCFLSRLLGTRAQTIWNPIFGVMFFTYLGLAEGKSFDQIGTKIKNDLSTAVMGSWAVWVPAHTVNFKFVPTSQRLLYINTIQASEPFTAIGQEKEVFSERLGSRGVVRCFLNLVGTAASRDNRRNHESIREASSRVSLFTKQ